MKQSERYSKLMRYLHPNYEDINSYDVFQIGGKNSISVNTVDLSNKELHDLGIDSLSCSCSLTVEQMKKLNDTHKVSFSLHSDMFNDMLRTPLRAFEHVAL